MNIIFVTPNYYPHIGGVEKHLKELSEEILKDGHNITIITVKFDESYQDYEKNNNIEIIRISKLKNKYKNRINIYYRFLKLLPKFLNADIIHFHDFGTLWFWALPFYPLLKLAKKKMFITFHGWEGDIPPKKEIIKTRKICEKITDGNICAGHFIEKWYGTKADVITYGGVHEIEESCLNENYAVFAGRLEEDTGIFDYIKAWKQINKDFPEFRFVICGDGSIRAKLEEYIKQEGLENIEFKGFVANPEKYVENAGVVLTSGYLGILEAFSCKKAVISFYDNELKKDYLEMMPNAEKMLWIAKSSEEIVLYLKEALHDNEKAQKAYEYSLNNSWEKVKNDYYKLWNIN